MKPIILDSVWTGRACNFKVVDITAQDDLIKAAVEFVEHAGAEVMTNCEYCQRLAEAVKRWKEAQ